MALYSSALVMKFLNQAHGLRQRMRGFLKLLWFTHQYACMSVCLSVCLSAPEGINDQWHDLCDIGRVRLVKQVSQLFPALNYFI